MIHSLWDDPPSEAPILLKQAHRLMMRTLINISPRVPNIFYEPEKAGGEKTMLAAIAAMQNPKLDPELRLAALSRLQGLMKTVDPSTPQRLFLSRPEWQSPISRTIGKDLDALAQFERALAVFIRAGYSSSTESMSPPQAAQLELGLLLALTVTRLAQCQSAVLVRFVEWVMAEDAALVFGPWTWLDVELSNGGSPELRRIFLTPTVLASLARVRRLRSHISPPKKGMKQKGKNSYFMALANRAFAVLLKQLDLSSSSSPINSFKGLRAAVVQRLRIVTTPVLATYAEGGFRSSSLEPSTWRRLIGASSPSGAIPIRTDTPPAKADPSLPQPVEVKDNDHHEQLAAGDLVIDGTIAELRRIMDLPREWWPPQFAALITKLGGLHGNNQTQALMVSWLQYLADDRKAKGKKALYLKDGTIKNYRGLLANRVIEILPSTLDDLSDDELEGFYKDIVESRKSPQQEGRIRAALASFDHHARTELPDLPTVRLPGFAGVSYDISARIISETEYLRGLAMTRDGTLALDSQPDLANQVRTFWTMSFRFGLRRNETLGLRCGDIHPMHIDIVGHSGRDLKTTNAHRRIPIQMLSGDEKASIECLRQGKSPKDYVFFDNGSTVDRKAMDNHVVVARIKDLLLRVTGDSHIHGHNLRHSAATLPLLGMLGGELGLADRPYAEPWMKDAVDWSENFDKAVSGQLHRRAGRGNALAMVLGHGSERTTYEHYTHAFDLVLHAATWAGTFTKKKRSPYSYLFPDRPERAIFMNLIGLPETSIVKTTDIPGLYARIGESCPGLIKHLEPLADSLSTTPLGSGSSAQAIILDDMLSHAAHQETSGFPAEQADRDSAATFCSLLNVAISKDAPLTLRLLDDWLSRLSKKEGAASFSQEEAVRFVNQIRSLMPSISIESSRKYREGTSQIKTPYLQITASTELAEMTGRYLIRFGENRGKRNKRSPKSGARRSRSLRTMTWSVLVLTDILRDRLNSIDR